MRTQVGDRWEVHMTEARPGWGRASRRVGGCRSVGDVVERVGVRAGAALLAAVETGDPRDLVVAEREVEDLEVLLHPLGVHRLREDDVAALDVPAQGHLRGRPALRLGD